MRLGARLRRQVSWCTCALSLACAAENAQQLQLDRARERVRGLQQYGVPDDYRKQIDAYLDRMLAGAGARAVMLAEPSGAIVCGHVKAERGPGAAAGYRPFGAIFDRNGAVRWVRIFQPFQGMYATNPSDPRPTDDDVAIALACEIPLVFR